MYPRAVENLFIGDVRPHPPRNGDTANRVAERPARSFRQIHDPVDAEPRGKPLIYVETLAYEALIPAQCSLGGRLSLGPFRSRHLLPMFAPSFSNGGIDATKQTFDGLAMKRIFNQVAI